MNFDLRLPIGVMFSVFGLILTIFGATSDKAIYEQHSLGININLIWGIVLLVFGVLMLLLALRGGKKPGPPKG
jgi:putative Mn2+ efflux pump MntP